MSPTLAALIALQALDSAAEAHRKRLADMPVAEQALATATGAARAEVDAAKAKVQENNQARRELEKNIAAVDTRLAKFDDHKAAVKTNHEYTALLHEIATAKAEKDSIEERLLVLMEEADTLAAAQKSAERALAEETERGKTAKAALDTDRIQIDKELGRLSDERAREVRNVDTALLSKYSNLLKQRKGIAVARMMGEICEACHVRLRPHVTQQVRRNDAIVQCDSCQRILYFVAPAQSATG
ncbi:MAG TPA: C4-type zinc ribbon domain-containing protein [Vicinamibacterales bacterium]|nr:C4-type zinc ribbon domain-containing protein [Vicinamibacterales bacterium]